MNYTSVSAHKTQIYQELYWVPDVTAEDNNWTLLPGSGQVIKLFITGFYNVAQNPDPDQGPEAARPCICVMVNKLFFAVIVLHVLHISTVTVMRIPFIVWPQMVCRLHRCQWLVDQLKAIDPSDIFSAMPPGHTSTLWSSLFSAHEHWLETIVNLPPTAGQWWTNNDKHIQKINEL